ncbi:4-phosphoerythronate dehydrogenase [Eionea flava]
MKILGDSQIRLFDELFSSLGETATYSGREITSSQLSDIDVLVTRSTVNVDKTLLDNTPVVFVGTCTIGTDHVDLDYLQQKNIAWANAPACNANAVVQYVLSAMAQLTPHWINATVGIIGCGNVGGRVHRRLTALGVSCRVYDPFLSHENNADLTSLDEVLQSDIITCHAPLTTDGAFPTYHMIGQRELEQLRPNTLLISAGRGAVINNQALLAKLSTADNTLRVALDVWENEPNILPELMARVDIATPHIAGHSLEGKEQGTVMIYNALCDHLKIVPPIEVSTVVNTEKTSLLDIAGMDAISQPSSQEALNQLLLAAYPIVDDDARLRAWSRGVGSDTQATVAQHFDHLRKTYPVRREYSHFYYPDSEGSDTSCGSSGSAINAWLALLSDS